MELPDYERLYNKIITDGENLVLKLRFWLIKQSWKKSRNLGDQLSCKKLLVTPFLYNMYDVLLPSNLKSREKEEFPNTCIFISHFLFFLHCL